MPPTERPGARQLAIASSGEILGVESQKPADAQQVQEDQYRFPYHYLDLGIEKEAQLGFAECLGNVRFILEQLKPWSGQRVLDIGCGDGRLIHEARTLPLRFEGTDYSEQAIRFARAFNPTVPFHAGALDGLHLESTFDQAVMLEVLEHIPPAEIPGALRAIAALQKPGACSS